MPDRPQLTHQPVPIQFTRERLRLVVFGEPGVGKTTLAMTFPKPLVIDADGGLISVTVERAGEELGEQFVPTGHKDLEGLYWWVKERADAYETIVIDSLDELVFTLMGELLDTGAAYDKAKGKEEHPTMQWVPEQREYFANQRQFHALLHALRQLNKHIVITSGVRDRLGEKRSVDVAPGLATIINRWASVLGELIILDEGDPSKNVPPGAHVLLTAPSNKRLSKTRFKALLPYVIEPSYERVVGRIEESFINGETKESNAHA